MHLVDTLSLSLSMSTYGQHPCVIGGGSGDEDEAAEEAAAARDAAAQRLLDASQVNSSLSCALPLFSSEDGSRQGCMKSADKLHHAALQRREVQRRLDRIRTPWLLGLYSSEASMACCNPACVVKITFQSNNKYW